MDWVMRLTFDDGYRAELTPFVHAMHHDDRYIERCSALYVPDKTRILKIISVTRGGRLRSFRTVSNVIAKQGESLRIIDEVLVT